MAGLEHIETAARKKLKASEEWRWFRCEAISGGFLIEGQVPSGTYSRGPRKGRPKFKPPGERVVVSEAEVEAEKGLYVRTTGNCPNCFGAKELAIGWSVDTGTRMGPCRECDGTGKANV